MLSGSYCFLGMLLGMAGLFGGDEAVDKNANENPGNIELTTEQVVVFKDGYCLVVKDGCLLYTSPSPRDKRQSRMPSSA